MVYIVLFESRRLLEQDTNCARLTVRMCIRAYLYGRDGTFD